MKEIKDLVNLVISWIVSLFIYITYNILYPLGIAMLVYIIYNIVLSISPMMSGDFASILDIETVQTTIVTSALFILNFFVLKFMHEFTIIFSQSANETIKREYNLHEFTKEEQEAILSQLTPEERKYIEEQMEQDDKEVKITLLEDEDDKEDDK